jgi:hypothetical protein
MKVRINEAEKQAMLFTLKMLYGIREDGDYLIQDSGGKQILIHKDTGEIFEKEPGRPLKQISKLKKSSTHGARTF